MRKNVAVLVIVGLFSIGSSNVVQGDCGPPYEQDGVICDTHCVHGSVYDGYCNVNIPSNPAGGCVMLQTGCASMNNVPCCTGEGLF